MRVHTTSIQQLTHARVINVQGITGRKKGPSLLTECEQTAILQSTIFVTNVSRRILRTCHGIWSNTHFIRVLCHFSCILFSSFFLSYANPCDHRDSFRHSKLLCLYTSAIVPSFLFSAFCYCYFRYSPFRHSLLAFSFVSNLVSHFLFASFVPASRSGDLPSTIFSPSSNIFSRVFRDSILSSIPLFYFYLSFASFRILRIRFSARALYVFRSFSRIVPAFFSLCSSTTFYPPFFNPPAATFSNFSRCFAVPDLLWSLIKKNNRKDVIGAAGEAEH